MRKEIKIQPYIYPMPVLMIATYNEDGTVNVMNAAWGCAIDMDMLGVCLSPDHKTNANFHRTGAFTVSLATKATLEAADYFGIATGKKETRKFEKTGLHASRAQQVEAPVIEEFPVCMECVLDHEEPDTGMVYGRIKRVSVDEKALDEKGAVDLQKAGAVLYDCFSRKYRVVGEAVADAWKAGLKFQK